jgi:aspartokinase/homoserine dehydrogenase 1
MQDRLGVDVSLVAVASSSKMAIDPAGLSLTTWKEQFESTGKPVDLQRLTNDLGGMDEDTVVFDCTAADEPCEFYSKWMEKGVHVITPNKKLHSGPIDRYRAVRTVHTSFLSVAGTCKLCDI